MKKNLILISGLVCLFVFSSCKNDKDQSSPALKEKANRTVLTYLFQDTNLHDFLTENINEMESGWDPAINGTMLVYVDASTKMTQFDGKPVLLEITHDTTNLVVSKIIKVYPDIDAANPEVFLQVQQDAIAMYPADSYGLVISGHGNGFFVDKAEASRGVVGSDRWGDNSLDVDVIAKNVATHYDFIIFDACLMGETTTIHQLRNVTDFVVASVELSSAGGMGFRSDTKALFTQPKADLYNFALGSMDFYKNTKIGTSLLGDDDYFTIGVYRTSAMEKLAAVTKRAIEKINLKYPALKTDLHKILGQPNLSSSMFYPREGNTVSEKPMYYDMGLLPMLLVTAGDNALAEELSEALEAVVIQSQFAFSTGFTANNPSYVMRTANLSFYIPSVDAENKHQNEAFYNRFEWSAASGFTSKWE